MPTSQLGQGRGGTESWMGSGWLAGAWASGLCGQPVAWDSLTLNLIPPTPPTTAKQIHPLTLTRFPEHELGDQSLGSSLVWTLDPPASPK